MNCVFDGIVYICQVGLYIGVDVVECVLHAQDLIGYYMLQILRYARGTTRRFTTEKLIKVNFVLQDGSTKVVEAKAGKSILEAAHENHVDLEGACEASLACSTCHVYVENGYFGKLEPACEEEEDMLDMAFALKEK
jgi:ferredoxin